MSEETVPTNRRIYVTVAPAASGRFMLRLAYAPPAIGETMVALLSRGLLMDGDALELPVVSDPSVIEALRGLSAYQVAQQAGYGGTLVQWLASLVGAKGRDAAAILGSVTITQVAGVQIAAGARRVVVTIPASWGVAVGEPLIALPTAALTGYVLHDVVALSATSLSIGVTAPLLAIGASYSITSRIARLNI